MVRLYHSDAELYDIAFDWDVTGEVDWLLERLDAPRRVLEPGCGAGRILEAFAARGVHAVGFDSSPAMVELARRRLAGRGRAVLADMASFDLGESFDAGVCPINTLSHLSREDTARHLDSMARHAPVYLVQLAIHPIEPYVSHWQAERGDVRLDVKWIPEKIDLARGVSRDRSRIEVLAGSRAGEIVEDFHDMTVWTGDDWARFVDASPFEETATYDGNEGGRPRVPAGTRGGLIWHEFRRRSG